MNLLPVVWIFWFTCFFGFVIHPHYVGLILGALIGCTLVIVANLGSHWESTSRFSPKRRLW